MRDNASNKYKIASVVKKLENEKIIIECCFLDGKKSLLGEMQIHF